MAGKAGAQRFGEAQTPGDFRDDPHRTDRGTLAKSNLVERAEGGQVTLASESQFDSGDLLGVGMGEVGDVAFADVRPVAVGLAQVDGLVDLAVGRGPGSARHIHVHTVQQYIA